MNGQDAPIEIHDDDPAPFFDRPGAKRLLGDIAIGDHVVVSTTSTASVTEFVVMTNRLLRRGVHVHLVDGIHGDWCQADDESGLKMLAAAEDELLMAVGQTST